MKKPKFLTKNKSPQEIAADKLSMFHHSDLQKECIGRGMPFENIVNWSHHKLAAWYVNNYEIPNDDRLLDEYDKWVDIQLEARGHKKGDAIMHPSLRFGLNKLEQIPDNKLFKPHKPEVENQPAPPKPIPSVRKEKAIKDIVTGVKSGTKKNLTYVLTRENKDIKEIIAEVKKQFPEADEKSIKIWSKRCLKEMNEG